MKLEHFFTDGTKEKFLIQDPFGLREVIQPVVSISQTADKITGLGTCFQVSPWLWLTAQHVVQHSSTETFPPDEVGAVGFSIGLAYGKVAFVTTDTFGAIRQVLTYKLPAAKPAAWPPNPTSPDIQIDVASLRVDVSNLKKARLVSPLPLATTGPAIGDEIFAIGYPILGSTFSNTSSSMIFEERMYGAGGIVTALHPAGTSAMKPWPTFEIEGNWEGGMSGGPVINLKGEVVGIVSSSFAPYEESPGVGFAVQLSAIPLQEIAPELDLAHPGFTKGYGVFQADQLIGFYPTKDVATIAAGDTDGLVIRHITHNPKTDEWMTL